MNSFYLMLALSITVCGQVCASSPAAHGAAPEPIPGNWYMGTGMGQDCYLSIQANGTLSVQYGGCFYQAPPVHGSWIQRDDKVLLTSASPDITKRLGPYLRIVHSRSYTVLVPQTEEPAVLHTVGYPCEFCFWQQRKGEKGIYDLPSQAWEDNRVSDQAAIQAYKSKHSAK